MTYLDWDKAARNSTKGSYLLLISYSRISVAWRISKIMNSLPSDARIDNSMPQDNVEVAIETPTISSILDSLSTPGTSTTEESDHELMQISNICYVGAGYVGMNLFLSS